MSKTKVTCMVALMCVIAALIIFYLSICFVMWQWVSVQGATIRGYIVLSFIAWMVSWLFLSTIVDDEDIK